MLIDGADVRDVELNSLRAQIGVVTDDPFLFTATVHDNIAYGRPDATREEVERAAERAQAAGFIAELPDGYDTVVGERGLTLSGGQRQRIAIARALVIDPRILVLDDATSSVDASTEQAIKQALREVMQGRTTFVIAHRLSTIALADDIVVLEDGEIAARGTHEELLRESELYAEIAAKGLPDQVFLNRDPVREGGGAVSGANAETQERLADLRRRWRATRGRGRKLRGLVELLRPYRGARDHWPSSRCSSPPARRSRRRRWPSSRSTRASRRRTSGRSTSSSSLFLVSALVYWGASYAQTYLVGWVGQRALQDLRIQLFAHLQTLSVGFYSRRSAGAIISRLTNDVQALDQLVSDGVVTLFGSSLTLIGTAAILFWLDAELALLTLLDLPGAGDRVVRVPDHLGRRLPDHAREDRRDHRLPAGDAVGHPRRARVRPGAAPQAGASPSSTTRTARRT